jgi:hypothetical protein
MSFGMELRILRPQTLALLEEPILLPSDDIFSSPSYIVPIAQVPKGKAHRCLTFWSEIERITGLGSRDGPERLAVTDVIYRGLVEKIHKPCKKTFAPYMLPDYEESLLREYKKNERLHKRILSSSDFIICGNHVIKEERILSLHNKMVVKREDVLLRHVKREYYIVGSTPLLWEDISTVISWCSYFDHPSNGTAREVKKNPFREAKARAVIAQLKAFALLPVKVLFTFS